jgi:hypothetical protein
MDRKFCLDVAAAFSALADRAFPLAASSPPPVAYTGGRPFAASSPFNTPTPSNTTWFDTPVLHSAPWDPAGTGVMHYSVAPTRVTIGSPTDPLWTLNLAAYDAPAWHRHQDALTAQVHAPATLTTDGTSDAIICLVNGTTYWEMWRGAIDSVAHTITSGEWTTGDIVTGTGVGAGNQRGGVRAANFSWAAGLITGKDLTASIIDHALVIALVGGQLSGTDLTKYRSPATSIDSGGWTGPILMGSRIGVPLSAAKPAGLTPLGAMVFIALQKYGAFVGDYAGGSWPLFYRDMATVTDAQVAPLYAFWAANGSADMEKIGPLLRVADYQP